jgi:hypothetical protein
MLKENKIVEIEVHYVCIVHSKKTMSMRIMPRNEHAHNVVRLAHNTNTQFNNNFLARLQSIVRLCSQIRTMKRSSSTEYLDALKESKENKICVSMCVVHSKKVMSKSIPLLMFLQNINY